MTENVPAKPAEQRAWIAPAVALLLLLGLVVASRYFPLDRWLLSRMDWIRAQGWSGIGIYLLVYLVSTIFLVPGTILTVAAGMAWGVALGSAVVVVSATLGASASFLIGRHLSRDWVARQLERRPRLAAIDRAVDREGFKIVFLTRLSPIFPFVLLNYAFGVTRVKFSRYALASLTGMIPGTVLYVYLGTLVTSLAELSSGVPKGPRGLYWGGLTATLIVTGYLTRVAARALKSSVRDA